MYLVFEAKGLVLLDSDHPDPVLRGRNNALVEVQFHVQTFLLLFMQQGLRARLVGAGWVVRWARWIID